MKKKQEEEEAMYRSGFGEASQRLDGLGDECEGSRGGGILAGQNYNYKFIRTRAWNSLKEMLFPYEVGVFALKIRLTGWCGRRWNRLGERMAGAKKRRKMKLLTAVKRTSGSTTQKKKTTKTSLLQFWIKYKLVCRWYICLAIWIYSIYKRCSCTNPTDGGGIIYDATKPSWVVSPKVCYLGNGWQQTLSRRRRCRTWRWDSGHQR